MGELRLSPSRLRREGDALAGLPYARHASDHIVTLDSGALMIAFQLQGAAFETADPRDLNDWHVKLNQTWRNLADDRLAIWHHIVRREVLPEVMGGFRSDFARDLSQAYEARLGGRRLFVNELFVTLVLHPGRDPGDRAAALMRRLQTARRQDTEVAPEQIKRLEDAARDLEQYLGRYAPRRLGLYQHGDIWCSEPMELVRLVLTGRPGRVPIVYGHLGSAVHTVRVIFGRRPRPGPDCGTRC